MISIGVYATIGVPLFALSRVCPLLWAMLTSAVRYNNPMNVVKGTLSGTVVLEVIDVA